MTSVVWTTPLGLPIVQPYRKTKRKQIMTSLQTVYISDPNSPAEVNALKQASAFPPNFIHSLDATHMMLTALECRTQGLTFASVHDSYWTHASSIDKMSEIIRSTFIALHSSDVLTRLQTEFKERYKGYKIPLVHIRTGQLFKQLKLAGAFIPDSAKMVPGVEALSTNLDIEGSAELNEGGSELMDDDKKQVKELDGETSSGSLGKFVDLTSLLPPIPKKGNFDVETIKGSQYFFS